MKKYRIMESHCTDPYEYYGIVEATSDEEAKIKLKTIENHRFNGYSKFYIERIDVEEKSTRLW